MFHRTAPVVEPAPVAVTQRPADLIPLSHLSLDVDVPGVGWDAYLTGRGIPIDFDDIGRKAVSRSDARQLLDEKHAGEAHAREAARRQEELAIEADQRFRAGLNKGVEWWRLPDNTSPGDAMALAAAQANQRKSVQAELMEQQFGGSQTSMVYQPYPNDEAEAS